MWFLRLRVCLLVVCQTTWCIPPTVYGHKLTHGKKLQMRKLTRRRDGREEHSCRGTVRNNQSLICKVAGPGRQRGECSSCSEEEKKVTGKHQKSTVRGVYWTAYVLAVRTKQTSTTVFHKLSKTETAVNSLQRLPSIFHSIYSLQARFLQSGKMRNQSHIFNSEPQKPNRSKDVRLSSLPSIFRTMDSAAQSPNFWL